MEANFIFLVEGLLVGGGALAFGFWQLWELRKLKREREEKEAREREEAERLAAEEADGPASS